MCICWNFRTCRFAQLERMLSVFFDRYKELCAKKGVSPTKAATEAGINKSAVTYWRTHPDATPTGQISDRLCAYFGITLSELYGEKEKPAEKASVNDDDLKFALFGTTEVDDATWDDVRAYAKFKQEQKNRR